LNSAIFPRALECREEKTMPSLIPEFGINDNDGNEENHVERGTFDSEINQERVRNASHEAMWHIALARLKARKPSGLEGEGPD
jgi:hypothetical protein